MAREITMYGHTTANVDGPTDIEVSANDLKLKKIPFWVIEHAVWFFRIIYFKQKTECAVLITYDPEEKEFGLAIPKQDVVYAHVDWKNEGDIDNVVGTIHSHCDFRGRFSGTDIDDNKKTPGLHIVIGNIDDVPSMEIELVVNRNKVIKDIDPVDIIRDFDKYKGLLECPTFMTTQTMSRVDEPTTSYSGGNYSSGYRGGHSGINTPSSLRRDWERDKPAWDKDEDEKKREPVGGKVGASDFQEIDPDDPSTWWGV